MKNIRYFGSQPWPFPHSLMVAFTAEYAGGELRPDGVEIEEARWFELEELPKLPRVDQHLAPAHRHRRRAVDARRAGPRLNVVHAPPSVSQRHFPLL